MALYVLHKMLLHAVALLVAKQSGELKRRRILSKILFGGLRKNFVTSPYFLKRHTHYELRPGVTQITLPNNKYLQSTLESKHAIKIKRCIVSPKGYLSPYSDFKMFPHLNFTATCEKYRTKRVAVTSGRRKTN
jgi:hypothetical protein